MHIFIPFLLLFSCAKPFLKVDSSLSAQQEAPTLLTVATIDASGGENQERSLIDVAQSIDLSKTGEHLIDKSTVFLKDYGFKVSKNKEQAQRIDIIKGDAIETGKDVVAVLSGVWFSKDTATQRIDNNTILLGSYRNNLVGKLNNPDVENEYFLFAAASVFVKTDWLIMKTPRMVIDYKILSEKGDVVFKARGVGYGETDPFIADKSERNLMIAIDSAINSIKAEPKEEL